MTVTVYARHSSKCPKSKDKNAGQWKRCKCPLWLQWNKDADQFKKSAKTRSWDIATKTARNLEQDLELEALGCAKKKCKLHAVREMREGPSKPLCRERLQTATSCCGTMATVVNVVVKSVDRPRQVWMRETNASEPPIKHRNLLRRRQNRGLRGAPGSVWWKPVYWPDGVRCIGGVTLI
jgi:hypothetical protein